MQHYRTEAYNASSSIGYLLKRAHSLVIDHLEAVVADNELTFTQWVVLMHLRDGLALNATTLCSQLRHDSGALTRVIDQLEGRGLLSRERSREDRRAVQLRLTDVGSATVASTIPAVVDKLNFAMREFSRAEAGELNRLLNKLIGSLTAAGESGEAA
ncbi:MAG TPA: MarR family winged helix-turn-helix transcriptional regulator [Steroidobacteraceae bacterium]|jgi:DNA-binding MarR family transcriptional regulator